MLFRSVEVVAAFDVVKGKVGVDLAELFSDQSAAVDADMNIGHRAVHASDQFRNLVLAPAFAHHGIEVLEDQGNLGLFWSRLLTFCL